MQNPMHVVSGVNYAKSHRMLSLVSGVDRGHGVSRRRRMAPMDVRTAGRRVGDTAGGRIQHGVQVAGWAQLHVHHRARRATRSPGDGTGQSTGHVAPLGEWHRILSSRAHLGVKEPSTAHVERVAKFIFPF